MTHSCCAYVLLSTATGPCLVYPTFRCQPHLINRRTSDSHWHACRHQDVKVLYLCLQASTCKPRVLLLQVFGGYGYLKEYQVERVWRDLRVHRLLEGTNEIMNVIIARELSKEQ